MMMVVVEKDDRSGIYIDLPPPPFPAPIFCLTICLYRFGCHFFASFYTTKKILLFSRINLPACSNGPSLDGRQPSLNHGSVKVVARGNDQLHENQDNDCQLQPGALLVGQHVHKELCIFADQF